MKVKSVYNSLLRHFCSSTTVFLAVLFYVNGVLAEEKDPVDIPNRYGLAVAVGNTYDPDSDVSFMMISGFALFDYEKIWPHRAPEALRFKIEASAGATWRPNARFMGSVGILALYYLDGLAGKGFRPFVEGGIGGIYTDWRVEGQGSRINFNPQLGFGVEFSAGKGPPFFVTGRLHHVSNAGLADDNRGVNSIVLLLGTFF